MFRIIFLITSSIFLSLHVNAQGKEDFQWPMGYPPFDPVRLFGGVLLDFSDGNPDINYFDIKTDANAISAISDKDGQLQFYTNGCRVMNGQDEVMENGYWINSGTIYNGYCIIPQYPLMGRYPSYQSLLSLPMPESDSLYYLFHTRLHYNFEDKDWLYSVINMNKNGGEGEVVEKNTMLLTDTLAQTTTAVRHANGRDWWVFTARDTTSLYYSYLLHPEGLSGPFTQRPEQEWIAGQVLTQTMKFSPDGKKMVRLGVRAPYFQVYDFDRCSGELYNPVTVAIQDSIADAPWFSFSRSGRYIYVSNWFRYLWQYDLWAPDISASAVLVGEYDGYQSSVGLPTSFYASTLGPDGRIYMASASGVHSLHVIHSPDSAGLACDFRQHDLQLPAHISFYTPNFPEFRLYAEEGTVCDSLSIEPPIVAYWTDYQDSTLSPLSVRFYDRSWQNPVTWSWDFGDSNTSNLSNPIHSFQEKGTYLVCLTACNALGVCDTACHNVDVDKKIVTFGQSYYKENMAVDLYPNPVHSELLLKMEGLGQAQSVEVFGLQGNAIISQAINTETKNVNLNVEELKAGVYIIRLSFLSGGYWLGKFVKV